MATSVRARLLIVEVGPNDLRWHLLSACQRDAASGLYALALAGYIQWLAGRYDDLLRKKPARIAELRDQARIGAAHRRTPTIVADLAYGWNIFLNFSQEVGVLGDNEAAALWDRVWQALGEVAIAQGEHHHGANPVLRFGELLRSAVTSGRAHLAGPRGFEPDQPEAWGWRRRTVGAGANERDEWQPLGDRIGWVTEDGQLYLDPGSAYRTAQAMCGSGDDGLPVQPRTLWKRMHEANLLVSIDEARGRHTVRVQLAGTRRPVLHVRASYIFQESAQSAQQDQDPEIARSSVGRFVGRFSEGPEKTAHRNGPIPPAHSAAGPIGPIGTLSNRPITPQLELDVADAAPDQAQRSDAIWMNDRHIRPAMPVRPEVDESDPDSAGRGILPD